MALVLTMGILLLVTLMAVGFFSTQNIESKASRNYSHSVVAEEMAQAAFVRAMSMLLEDRDTTNAASEFKRYDALTEPWGPRYPGGNTHAFSYQSGEGMDIDPTIEGSVAGNDLDARQVLVTDATGKPIGAFYVLIMPENSKININTAGNRTAWASLGTTAFDGYTPYAISLDSFLAAISSTTIDDQRVLNWRWSGDPGDNGAGPGADGTDDNNDNPYLEQDKIDNNSDGQIDEAGEGTDDPLEYNIRYEAAGSPNLRILTANDFSYMDSMMALFASTGAAQTAKTNYLTDNLGSYLTATSYTNDLIDYNGDPRISINQKAFPFSNGTPNADAANKKGPRPVD